MEEDSAVYKLVGPVLLNVEMNEAKHNVGKRLEYIEGEISKVEASIGMTHCYCFNFI